MARQIGVSPERLTQLAKKYSKEFWDDYQMEEELSGHPLRPYRETLEEYIRKAMEELIGESRQEPKP